MIGVTIDSLMTSNLSPAASEAATGAMARATASAEGAAPDADEDDESPADEDEEDEASPLATGFGGANISAIASLIRARAISIMRSGGTSANAHALRIR